MCIKVREIIDQHDPRMWMNCVTKREGSGANNERHSITTVIQKTQERGWNGGIRTRLNLEGVCTLSWVKKNVWGEWQNLVCASGCGRAAGTNQTGHEGWAGTESLFPRQCLPHCQQNVNRLMNQGSSKLLIIYCHLPRSHRQSLCSYHSSSWALFPPLPSCSHQLCLNKMKDHKLL